MLRYCANLKAIRYESTSLNRIVADKSHRVRATFHLTIFMREQRATSKIQRNNYRHGSCGLSLTGKTPSVPLIFTHGAHQNVKNR